MGRYLVLLMKEARPSNDWPGENADCLGQHQHKVVCMKPESFRGLFTVLG